MKKLILAPFSMHRGLLFKYRKDNPFFDCKFLTKEDLVSSFFFSLKKEALPLLINNFNISITKANKIISILPYILDFNDEKYNEYETYYSFLKENDLLKTNAYFYKLISGVSSIDCYYSNKDKIINHFFQSDDRINYIENNNDVTKLVVEVFNEADDEVNYVLNEVSKLVEKGVAPEDIYICTSNEDYLYYLEKYAPLYNLSLSGLKGEKLLFNKVSALFLEYFKANPIDLEVAKTYVLDIVKSEKNFDKIYSILCENTYSYLPKNKQLELYEYALMNSSEEVEKYTNSIHVVDDIFYSENAYVFILNFVSNAFPKNYGDDDEIRDKNKQGTLLLTAEEKNYESKEKCLEILKSNNHIYLSRSASSFSSKFYPTSLINELDLKCNYKRDEDTFYSEQYAKLLYARKKDLNRLYKYNDELLKGFEKKLAIPYREYSNVYQNINVDNSHSNYVLSFTSLNDYFSCPFSYYIKNNYLKDNKNNRFALDSGNIAHALLENSFNDDFDFDKEFLKEFSKPEYAYFSNKEKLFLDIKKQQIKEACLVNKKHFNFIKNPSVIKEYTFKKLQITDFSSLIGKADKIIISDNTYYFVIDYKTGSTKFDSKYLDYGKGLQLPIYALLCKNDEKFSDMTIGGLYINNIIDSKYDLNLKEDNLIKKHLKLNGVSLNDYDAVFSFDSSISGGVSEFISSVKAKDELLKASKAIINKDDFDKFAEIAKTKLVEASIKIKNNEFDIRPFQEGNNDKSLPCKYCDFRDICFLREYQIYKPEPSEEDDE